jgi:hypothetical protein
MVAAGGNKDTNEPVYPAAFSNLIVVSDGNSPKK